MYKNYSLLFIILVLFSFQSNAQLGGWVAKNGYGGGNREGAVGFSIGTKGYIAFGNGGGTARNSLWEFDQATGAWAQKANGSARQYAVAFVVSGKAYVGTGEDASFTRDKKWNEYNPTTNTWAAKTDFGGTARTEAVAFAIGTKGYLGTGYDGALKKDFWEYDPIGNTWTQKADFGGTARRSAVGFAVGSKGYVGTGNDGAKKKDFWEYDATANTWTPKTDFGGTARESAVGFPINTKGYIATGDDGTGKKDIWEYTPSTNSWAKKMDFTAQRRYVAAAFSIGDKGYVGTGFTDEPAVGVSTSDFYEFIAVKIPAVPSNLVVTAYSLTSIRVNWKDNSTDETSFSIERSIDNVTFSSVGTVTSNTQTFTDNTVSANQVYYYKVKAVNGDGESLASNVTSQKAERYETGLWTKLADVPSTLRTADDMESFVIGQNIFAMFPNTSTATGYAMSKNVWAYDTESGTWTQKADFGGTARFRAVTFSINGKGYAGLGTTSGLTPNQLFKDIWQYDPSANSWTQKNNFVGSARYGVLNFVLNGKAYIGAGVDSPSGGAGITDFWQYDPVLDSWSQKADIPVGGYDLIGFAVNDIGYSGIGTFKQNFYAYNPTTNTWSPKAFFPNGISVVDPTGLATANGKAYLHFDDNASTHQLWEYQIDNDRWIELTKSPISRSESKITAVAGNKIYSGISSSSGLWYSFDNSLSAVAPANFKAEVIDPLKVRLTWENKDVSSATIRIYKSSTINGTYSQLISLATPTAVFIENFDAINNEAYYKIQIENEHGFSAVSAPVKAVNQGTWTRLKDKYLTGSSLTGVVFSINGKGYYGFAESTSDDFNRSWWEYDPQTDQWTQKAAFSGAARKYATGFAVNNSGYVGLGKGNTNNEVLKDFWQFNPADNTWTKKADFAGSARYEAAGIGKGTKGYIFCGSKDADNFFSDTWEYTPDTDTWTQRLDVPGQVRKSPFVFSYNDNTIMVGAGGYQGSLYIDLRDFYEFTISSNTWTRKADIPTYAYQAPAFTVNNKGYVLTNNTMYEYSPVENSWITRVTPPTTYGHVFTVNNKAYLIFGSSSSQFWVFNPLGVIAGPENLTSDFKQGKIKFSWTDAASNESKYLLEVATAGSSYQVVKEYDANTTSTEITDLPENANLVYRVKAVNAAGEQSQASNLVIENSGPYWQKITTKNIPYRYGATSVLIDDKLYYGFGLASSNEYKKDFWKYDPATDTWTQIADFGGAARSTPVTFVIGSEVYAGLGSNSGTAKDFWKYSPSSNTWASIGNFPGAARSFGAIAAVSGNNAYVGTGFGGVPLKDIWEFNASTNTWTSIPDMATARYGGFSFVMNNKLIVGAGQGNSGGLNDVWEFDLTSRLWTQRKDIPSNVNFYNTSIIGEFVNGDVAYILSYMAMYKYFPLTDKWNGEFTRLQIDQSNVALGAADNVSKVYVVGSDQSYGKHLWQFSLAPAMPSLAEIKLSAPQTAQLKWRKIIPATDTLLIYKATTFSGPYAKIASIVSTDTTYTDTGLTPATTYYYKLKAASKAGRSPFSYANYLTIPSALNAPSGLTASLTGVSMRILLQWTNNNPTTGLSYIVQRSVDDENNFVTIGTPTEASFTDSNIEDRKIYYYKVMATTATNNSPFSNVASLLYVGTEETNDNLIKAYPSPTKGIVHLNVSPALLPVITRVYNMQGKLVTEQQQDHQEIDLSDQTPGIYIISITSTRTNINYLKKIVKR